MHDAEIVFKGISMLRPLHENVLGTLTAIQHCNENTDSEHGIGPVFQKIAPYLFPTSKTAASFFQSFASLERARCITRRFVNRYKAFVNDHDARTEIINKRRAASAKFNQFLNASHIVEGTSLPSEPTKCNTKFELNRDCFRVWLTMQGWIYLRC